MPGEVEWTPGSARIRYANQPGDIRVRELPEKYDGCGWYWTAYVNGERINGGLCYDREDGIRKGKNAVAAYRDREFLTAHYWDVETASWILRGHVSDTRAV